MKNWDFQKECNHATLDPAFMYDPMPDSPEIPPSEAFVSALTKHQSALRGYCYAALGHGDEAAEALQRTNIVLWKKSSDWDPETEFMRWATAVARFEVKGVLRDLKRERKRLLFDSDVAEQMMDEAAEAVLPTSERWAALEICLEKVERRNRDVLTMFYSEGKTISEISASEGRGESAIKVMLMRLRKSLGDCIESRLAKGATG